MKALVLDQQPMFIEDYPAPERKPGEALVAMRVAGVCDTDLQLAQGYMTFRGVLGHEFVGEVLEADDASLVGKRIVADINAGCGECDDCISRNGHHCAQRTVLGILGRGGAMAEQLVVPERCVYPVPDEVSDDRAVFAEPLAAGLHVLDVVAADAERVIVLGDGKLGLLTALAVSQSGLATTLVGHHRHKLDLAIGVDTSLESELPDGLTAAVVVEATGTAAGLERALSLCQPRGTLVLKTTVADKHAVDLSAIVINELSVVGSRCGDMAAALSCLADGRVDPTPLIAARYPLAEADRALEHAGRRGVLKVLIDR